MKTRKLCNIEVSEIGMGCMAFSHGYGAIPSREYAMEAIRSAYDHGCTFFDTAEVYIMNITMKKSLEQHCMILEKIVSSPQSFTFTMMKPVKICMMYVKDICLLH